MGRTTRTTAACFLWLLPMIWWCDATFAQQPVPIDPSLTNDLNISLWNTSLDLRGALGYKDNVELTESDRIGSFFWNAGADFILFRLPTGPWNFNFFASGDERMYFGGSSQNEQVIIAAAQATRSLPNDWSLGLGANYTFQNQILDVTSTETNQFPITRVFGNSIIGRWFVRKNFKLVWLQMELTGGRAMLASPLDSLWQFGPRLTLGHSYGKDSELSLNYQFSDERFDTRTDVTAAGAELPGTSLRFISQTAELNWRHTWDKPGRWRTYMTLGYDVNEDNGPGYFNYSQYRVAARAEYKLKTWDFSAFARFGYYGYPVQTISTASTELRSKIWVTAGMHAEKQLGKHLKFFADYIYDRSDSNVTTDLYYDSTVSIGFDWKL